MRLPTFFSKARGVMDCTNLFYMWSTEEVDFGPVRRCCPKRRLRCLLQGKVNDEYLLVNVDPPLSLNKYLRSEPESAVSQVVVAPHLLGTSLFPIERWPLPVYVCYL